MAARARAAAAAALGEVNRLVDRDLDTAVLVEQLRQLRADVAVLAAAVQRLLPTRPSVTPTERRVVQALHAVFGVGVPMTSAEIVAACRLQVGGRPELRAALQGLIGAALDAQAAGLALRKITARCADEQLRLVATKVEGGRRMWTIEESSPPRSTAPHCGCTGSCRPSSL